jgi:hypothetical protein
VLAALLLVVFVPVGSGQGSRKDDIVLNRFGQPVSGASVTVCTSGATGTPCSPLASIFSDVALSQPLANPLTSDGQGNYHFYAAPGRYMIQFSGAGVSTTTIPDVLLPADPTAPSYQSLTVTQNINALNLNLSGNLSVSGGISSPTTVSAPQTGSAAPSGLGVNWSPGMQSGLASPPSTASQALEITALAYLPNGSKKILQYLVAPVTANTAFPAALTLDGYSDAYSGPNHNFFQVSGNQDSGDGACGGPLTPYPVAGVGVPDHNPDVNYVINGNPGPGSTGIPWGQRGNYTGTGGSPSVEQVALASNLQTVQSLNALAQTIIQNADAVIAGPATQANMPSAMSSSNPMTVAIAGDPSNPSQGSLSLTGGFTGYGLLLVTGNFTYTPDTNWNGVILVIGQGKVSTIAGGGGGMFSGAMLIAQTRDSSGNLLPGPNPGPATFNDSATSTVGRGYFYNCSWILAAETPLTYRILAFHEIPQ